MCHSGYGRNLCISHGQALVEIVTVETSVNHLLYIWLSEAVLPGEILVIDLHKGFKIVLYALVIIRKTAGSGDDR